MTQTSPPPHSGTLNGGKGKKMIHPHSYSSNTATVHFFLFQRGEIGAGRPLVVPGGLITNLEGVIQTISKSKTASDFRRLK
jgi:hypothetical protein